MDCAKAAEVITQKRLGDQVEGGTFDQARDHVHTCGCDCCRGIRFTINGDGTSVSIGQA